MNANKGSVLTGVKHYQKFCKTKKIDPIFPITVDKIERF